MVATGTGIAPYRAYLRRMFMEDVPDYQFTGLAWLFMGVANSDAKLYDDEFQAILQKYPKQVSSGSGEGLCYHLGVGRCLLKGLGSARGAITVLSASLQEKWLL